MGKVGKLKTPNRQGAINTAGLASWAQASTAPRAENTTEANV